MTSTDKEISIGIRQMRNSIEGITIHSEGNMSGEDRVFEEDMPVDIVVIRHEGQLN
jgi:hypothetical protein